MKSSAQMVFEAYVAAFGSLCIDGGGIHYYEWMDSAPYIRDKFAVMAERYAGVLSKAEGWKNNV